MNANSYSKTGINNGGLVLTERFARANLRFALAKRLQIAAQGFSPALTLGYASPKIALSVRRSSGRWDEGGKVAAETRL
jgi:hypothetical protein